MAENMGINTFLQAFGGRSIAKANRFKVEFQLPSGIGNTGVFTNTNSESGNITQRQNELNPKGQVNVMCHSCTLPGREIQPAELKQYGPPHRMPLTSAYSPVSFSFYSPSNLSVREYFEVWQTAIVNISSNTMNFYDEYTNDIRISILDDHGECEYYVDLYESWPSSIGLIDYAYSNSDTPQTVMVIMQYKYWQSSHDDTRVAKTV